MGFVLVAKYLSNLSNNTINVSGFLLIPIVYNFALHGGFYSFLFGLTASFFTISYYLYHEDNLQIINYIILVFIFNFIYLLHLLTFAMTLGVLFTYSVFPAIIKFYLDRKLTIDSISKTIKLLI